MNKRVYLGIFIILASLFARIPVPARAETQASYSAAAGKPHQTPAVYTAMLFYKLSGKKPEFSAWAQYTPEYRAAEAGDKLAVQDQQAEILRNIYNLLTLQEPLVVEIPAKLSPYSETHQGFFIENFKNDTFFPSLYNGQGYAVVPLGIMDHQWIKITDAGIARNIEAANTDKDHPPTVLLMLTPKYADKSAPATLNGENYWLISTEIKKMAIYAPNSSLPLWQSDDESRVDDSKRQELLKLRQ